MGSLFSRKKRKVPERRLSNPELHSGSAIDLSGAAPRRIKSMDAVVELDQERQPTLRAEDVFVASDPNTQFRDHMEDYVFTSTTFGRPDAVMTFLGVFDGHGGETAAHRASELVPQFVEELMDPSQAIIPVSPDTALQQAFRRCQEQLLEEDVMYEGTTATCALIEQRGGVRTLYVAYVGDSLAILSTNREPVQLVVPHNKDNPAEVARVQEAGGFFARGKLDGMISVSRCLGNNAMANHIECAPDVHVHVLNESHEILVIASDGLWDVVTPQAVVQETTRCFAQNTDPAQHLVNLALQNGTADNITIICARLSDF